MKTNHWKITVTACKYCSKICKWLTYIELDKDFDMLIFKVLNFSTFVWTHFSPRNDSMVCSMISVRTAFFMALTIASDLLESNRTMYLLGVSFLNSILARRVFLLLLRPLGPSSWDKLECTLKEVFKVSTNRLSKNVFDLSPTSIFYPAYQSVLNSLFDSSNG